jgi:hypothetical protein
VLLLGKTANRDKPDLLMSRQAGPPVVGLLPSLDLLILVLSCVS